MKYRVQANTKKNPGELQHVCVVCVCVCVIQHRRKWKEMKIRKARNERKRDGPQRRKQKNVYNICLSVCTINHRLPKIMFECNGYDELILDLNFWGFH